MRGCAMSKDISEFCEDLSPEVARHRILTGKRPVSIKRTGSNHAPGLPAIVSAKNLVAKCLTRPAEIVEGLLHADSVAVFGGASKTNKTWCLTDLAVSV